MINRILLAVLMLSIAGGVISSFFLAAQKNIYKFTSANFVLEMNTLVIFCFVIPFFKILSYADYSSALLQEGNLIVWIEQGTTKQFLYSMMDTVHFADSITEIWLFGVIIYLFYELGSYFFYSYFIRKRSEAIQHDAWVNILHRLTPESSFQKNISLLTSDVIGQPCVAGIKKSMILVPHCLLDILEPEEIEMVLRHELTHIEKRDIFFKFFISLLNSLNWFNPLFYMLKNNLTEWIEIACDESVTVFMGTEQRKQYINVLIKLNEEQWKQQQKRSVLCFNNQNLRTLKRRMWGVMKKRDLGSHLAKATVLTLMFGVICGGSVIAKASDYSVNEIFSNHVEALDLEENSFEEEFQITDEVVFQKTLLDVGTYTEFVFENGDAVEIMDNEDISTRHQHTYKDGTVRQHKKLKDGSCKVTIYKAKICTVCNKVVKGEIDSENTYKPCRHS